MVSRRVVVSGVATTMLIPAFGARGQTRDKVPRVGAVLGVVPGTREAFVAGLHDLGWTEPQNISLDIRQRDEEIAALVRLNVDVLTLPNAYRIRSAMKLTRTIPIIGIDLESDPVANGFVKSLARPGGNVTGVWTDVPEIAGKQLQMLREAAPDVRRIAVVWDDQLSGEQFRIIQTAARAMGVTIYSAPLHDDRSFRDRIDTVLNNLVAARPDALLLLTAPIVVRSMARFAALALEHRLPSISGFTAFPDSGGLLGYGPNFPAMYRQAAGYVDRILKGARAGELPVNRPAKFELRINAQTARTLGVKLPASLLARADEVIGGH